MAEVLKPPPEWARRPLRPDDLGYYRERAWSEADEPKTEDLPEDDDEWEAVTDAHHPA